MYQSPESAKPIPGSGTWLPKDNTYHNHSLFSKGGYLTLPVCMVDVTAI